MSPAGTGKIAAITDSASGIGAAACRWLLPDIGQVRLFAWADGFASFQPRVRPVASTGAPNTDDVSHQAASIPAGSL